jgi:hypothetical protein
MLADITEFMTTSNIARGRIGKQYDCIGLPFLNRPRGGVDAIVAAAKGAS